MRDSESSFSSSEEENEYMKVEQDAIGSKPLIMEDGDEFDGKQAFPGATDNSMGKCL